MTLRNWRSATSSPEPTQRSIWSPGLQRFTLRQTVSTIENADSITLVQHSVRRSWSHGVFQAATAFWPGYPECLEIHGTKGTAIVTGDRLTTWDVKDDSGEAPPLEKGFMGGAPNTSANLSGLGLKCSELGQICKICLQENMSMSVVCSLIRLLERRNH